MAAAAPAGGAGVAPAAAGAPAAEAVAAEAVAAEAVAAADVTPKYGIGDPVVVTFSTDDEIIHKKDGLIMGYLVRLDKPYYMGTTEYHAVQTGNPKSILLPPAQRMSDSEPFEIGDGIIVGSTHEGHTHGGGKSRSRRRRRRQSAGGDVTPKYGIGDPVVVKFHRTQEQSGSIMGYLVRLVKLYTYRREFHHQGSDFYNKHYSVVRTGHPKSTFLRPEHQLPYSQAFRILDGELVEPKHGGGKSRSRRRRRQQSRK